MNQLLKLISIFTFSGYVIRKTGNIVEGQRTIASTLMLANSLVVRRKVIESNYSRDELNGIFGEFWRSCEDKPLNGRDHILASICPQVIYYRRY